MESIIYDRGYLKTLSDYIEQTFWSEIEKYPQITEHYKQKINVRFLSDMDRLWEYRFKRHKGHFTRKYVQESFSSKMSYYTENSLEAVCSYRVNDNDCICHINRMYLYCNMAQILLYLFNRISILDTKTEDHIKHIIKIIVRHEVGHILDFVNEIDNRHKDHVDNREKIYMSAYDELFSTSETNNELSVDDFLIKYYSQIPCERRANELVGLTPQDFLFKFEKEN